MHDVEQQAIDLTVMASPFQQAGRVQIGELVLEAFDVARQGIHIHLFTGHADGGHRFGDQPVITAADAVEKPGHCFPGLLAHVPDHAEIDKADTAIAQQHQVAGVYIGMEEIAQHQAGEPGVERRDQGFRRVRHMLAQYFQVSQRHAEEALHGEHPRSGKFPVRCWRHGTGILCHVQKLVEAFKVVRLLPEITFLQHRALQFLHHTGHRRPRQARRQHLDHPRRKIEKVEIGQQDIAHIRFLHLDDHVVAIVQACGVHLGNGGRGQRLRVHPGVDVLQRPAKLCLHRVADKAERQCRCLVEALLELLDILIREQRRRTGNELPQFDIGSAQ